ncbi:MAG: polysaccharide deacetylase family protein [Leptolyngbya sp. SIO1E4]|nr:polysaccharide deacetylase family protein [Leptolyngbya sp. SIO1E4]
MRRRIIGIAAIIVGLLGLIFNPPQWLFTRVLSPVVCPGAVYAVNTPEKIVALTIDDGPDLRLGDANSTTQILDVLQQHNQQETEFTAHATFFLIGNQVKQRETLNHTPLDAVTARIIQDGHEIGNHMAEDGATILLGDRFFQAFDDTHQRLMAYAQLPESQYAQVRWLRPGVGWCDLPMIRTVSQQETYLSRSGAPNIALGSIWPYDTAQSGAAFSRWFIRHNLRPGAIIILHDSGSWGDRTAQVLEGLLQDLAQRAYTIVPLSQLLERGEPVALSQGFPQPIEAMRTAIVVGVERIRLWVSGQP